ncbi:MAG: hypothetical protein F6K19_23220 [Cyanothece sp. SIO1E1]|nr:hypothetical protein [Cyanothece sp. SIO1E1]
MDSALDQAVQFLASPVAKSPEPEAVVEALLQAEKAAKQTKVHYAYPQLLGQWRLGFITGTRRSRQKAGTLLGAGRFLPPWVKIYLSYSSESIIARSEAELESAPNQGTVANLVELGPVQMVLTGPTQLWTQTNILGFDFTRIKVSLSGLKLYEGYIRGGQDREAHFYGQTIKQQAFFNYFLVEESYIAARGRGGGLALWTRARES